MVNDTNLSYIDIPLSCSLFLEPALVRYRAYIAPISTQCAEYVHEWNQALMSILRDEKYRDRIGNMGAKLLRHQKQNSKEYLAMCVDHANDVKMQSLHYAIRFGESIRFLDNKIAGRDDIKFVDLGCGLSPMAGATQTAHPTSTAYCIDFPYISDVYSATARAVGGGEPTFISWEDAQHMAQTHELNTLVSMGAMHYMPIDEQVRRLKFTNKYFENFMIEIKYAASKQSRNPNAFSLSALQNLRMNIPGVQTIETTMLANTMRYLHAYRTALPQHRIFVQDTRALFLSR